MSDKGIQVGDEVYWNWGGGQPTGVVKEMKTSGKLEIESNGKLVHKNADEGNPAVHVEREGNDVVKRASELERLRGGGAQDNAGGETAVQEVEGPKTTTRSGRRGGRQATAETRKRHSEAGKKGGAATAAKKAAGRRRGKATAEEAVVGEKRQREGLVEEKGEKEGEDINIEKGEKERVEVTTVIEEQERAERDVGKEAKKPRISPERLDEEYVPGEEVEEAEEEVVLEEKKLAESTGPTTTAAEIAEVSEELKDLERDNRALGLDVGVEAEPRRAAEVGYEEIAVTAEAEAGTSTTGVPTASGERPSPTSEKKRGGRKATRAKGA